MAEKRMVGVNPLYYEMKKANSTLVNNEEIYNGLQKAFSSGKIGQKSNDITKCWNSENVTQDSLDAIKWLCMETNFSIDSAKTSFEPTRPENIDVIIKSFTQNKVPYFFQYAKDKTAEQCEYSNNSSMNKICNHIIDKPINFSKLRNMQKINYKLMTSSEHIIKNDKIDKLYNKLNKVYGNKFKGIETRTTNEIPLKKYLQEQFSKLGYRDEEISNSLCYYLYSKSTARKKNLLWLLYGDIIYKNLSENLGEDTHVCRKCGKRDAKDSFKNGLCQHCRSEKQYKTIICQDCGIEFEVSKKNNKTVRCKECQSKINLEKYIKYNKKRK